MKPLQDLALRARRDLPAGVLLGFDLVQVSAVARSLAQFGAAFEDKLFTPGELAYARGGAGLEAERLAARFAAKEAVIKALRLADEGVSWRDIEVVKQREGDCELRLHGRVAAAAAGEGARELRLSLSHDGDYAGAVVTILC
jgi:holo-[acyl-carrier protein] synthase